MAWRLAWATSAAGGNLSCGWTADGWRRRYLKRGGDNGRHIETAGRRRLQRGNHLEKSGRRAKSENIRRWADGRKSGAYEIPACQPGYVAESWQNWQRRKSGEKKPPESMAPAISGAWASAWRSAASAARAGIARRERRWCAREINKTHLVSAQKVRQILPRRARKKKNSTKMNYVVPERGGVRQRRSGVWWRERRVMKRMAAATRRSGTMCADRRTPIEPLEKRDASARNMAFRCGWIAGWCAAARTIYDNMVRGAGMVSCRASAARTSRHGCSPSQRRRRASMCSSVSHPLPASST